MDKNEVKIFSNLEMYNKTDVYLIVDLLKIFKKI